MPSKKQLAQQIEDGRDGQKRQAKLLRELKGTVEVLRTMVTSLTDSAIQDKVEAEVRLKKLEGTIGRHEDEIRETLEHANSAMRYCKKHTHPKPGCQHKKPAWTPLLFHMGVGVAPASGCWCECGAIRIGGTWHLPNTHLALPTSQIPEDPVPL